jgi:hypothetical protein
MPEDLVRRFSKRTGQIDTELDRLGTDGGERQASAGHDDDLGPLGGAAADVGSGLFEGGDDA